MSAQYEVRGRTAVVALDFPPVNGIGSALRKELHALFSRAIADEAVRAVVITGTHKAFSAGADVKEFGTEAATQSPRLAELITAFEESPKPVIAAISGVCMGGGLELALGAHYRVARSDARIALPEVKLGLMPGAGGTQRRDPTRARHEAADATDRRQPPSPRDRRQLQRDPCPSRR